MSDFKTSLESGLMELFFLIKKWWYTLKNDWIYFVMAFAIPLSLYFVAQGQEIVACLFDDRSWAGMGVVLLSFVFLFYFIWAIPTCGIKFFKFLDRIFHFELKEHKDHELFFALADFNNTGNKGYFEINREKINTEKERPILPVRVIANQIFFIFIFVLTLENFNQILKIESKGEKFLYLILFLLLMNYLACVTKKLGHTILSKYFKGVYKGYFVHFAFIVVISGFWSIFDKLNIISIVFMVIFWLWNNNYHFFIESANSFIENSEGKQVRSTKLKLYQDSQMKYSVAMILIIVLLIIMALLVHIDLMHFFSPIVILNFVFAFYIGLIDLFFKTPQEILEILMIKKDNSNQGSQERFSKNELVSKLKMKAIDIYGVGTFLSISILMYSFFVESSNDHRIYRYRVARDTHNKVYVRDSLRQYYQAWKTQTDGINRDVIYLVAGQGGGSRAGAWFGMVLDSLCKSNPLLRQRIFAISTVSGSSTGANMLLNKWCVEDYLKDLKDLKNLKDLTKEDTIPTFPFFKHVYSYNYLSCGLWGLLFSDGITGWIDRCKDFDRDRNYFHQWDEYNAFKTFFNDSLNMDTLAKNLFFSDYMWKWSGVNKYKYPLHFLNTSFTETGNRGIIAPVVLDTLVHFSAFDVYKEFQPDDSTLHWTYAFPASAAVKCSQSFPIISAYSLIDKIGHSFDGGAYDNSGGNTLMELYTAIRRFDDSVKIIILNIQNSSNYNDKDQGTNSIFMNTLSSVSSSPFSGHSYYWEKTMATLPSMCSGRNSAGVEVCDSIKEFNAARGVEWNKIPLGIYLSAKSIDSLHQYIKF